MGEFQGITFPEWQGDPPGPQTIEYDPPTGLLPLERTLLAKAKWDADGLKVYSRQHTVCGYYTDFTGAKKIWIGKAGAGDFFLLGETTYTASVLHTVDGQAASLEIYTCGEVTFPSDGMIRRVEYWLDPETEEMYSALGPSS